MTQAELAASARTSQAAISAYESGRRSPSVETLSRIIAAAGFELRMRSAPIDHHDGARRIAESMLPTSEVEAFNDAERKRANRARTARRRGPA